MADEAGVDRVVLPASVLDTVVVDFPPYAAWAGVGWKIDADQCVESLANWQPNWVVVDHYAFDARWHCCVADGLNTLIAVIDDLADRDLSAELLVDHNLSEDHRKKYHARLHKRTVVLGGPRFALLGPAYASAVPLVIKDAVNSIGIFMGGVDAGNLSSLVLRACRERAGFLGKIEIVVTRAYPHANELRTLSKQWDETFVISDLRDLAAFFARHDLHIGGGGGATWERCRIGAPTLALTAAANQNAVLPELAKVGAVALIAEPDPPNEDSIGRAVQSLIAEPWRRQELSERSRALVDGLGSRRVALRLAATSMSVRPATKDDSESMYVWRNHLTTRSMSLHPDEIPWLDHQLWLDATLKTTGRCLLVGSVGNTDVGIVRFDARSEDQFEVSLYLDPTLHGLSLGHSLLLAGEEYVLQRHPAIRRLVATVLDNNRGSIRLFSSCGYQLWQGLWQKNVNSGMKEVN